MGEVVKLEEYRPVITELSQRSINSIGQIMTKNISFDKKRIINCNYGIEDRSYPVTQRQEKVGLLELFDYKAGTIVLPEGDVTKKDFLAFLEALDECRYPFITSGYFFKGDLFYNRGDTFSNESLSVELLDVSFDKLFSLSNVILKKFMINSVLLKDEDTESVFLIMKE